MQHFTSNQRNPLASQLGKTVNVAQMHGQTVPAQRAVTRSLLHRTVVVALHVEQDFRRRRQQRGEVKSAHFSSCPFYDPRTLDQTKGILEEMQIIRVNRLAATRT